MELRARLSLQREAEGREQGQRRERILGEKRDKQQMLLEHLEAIDLHSRTLAQAASLRSGRTQIHTNRVEPQGHIECNYCDPIFCANVRKVYYQHYYVFKYFR